MLYINSSPKTLNNGPKFIILQPSLLPLSLTQKLSLNLTKNYSFLLKITNLRPNITQNHKPQIDHSKSQSLSKPFLSVRQLGSDKTRIGFNSENQYKSSYTSKIVFVKSTSPKGVYKPPFVQRADSNYKKGNQRWNNQKSNYYCVYCDYFGHSMSNCAFSGDKTYNRTFGYYGKPEYERYPNYRNTYASSLRKRRTNLRNNLYFFIQIQMD